MPGSGPRPSSSNTNDDSRYSYGSATLNLPDSSSLSHSDDLPYLPLECLTEMELASKERRDSEPDLPSKLPPRMDKAVRQGWKNMKTAVKGLMSRMPGSGSRPSSSNTNDDSRYSYGSATLNLPDSSSLSHSDDLPYLPLECLTEMELASKERRDSEPDLPPKLPPRMDKARMMPPPLPPRLSERPQYPIIPTEMPIYLTVLAPPPPRAGSGGGATSDVTWHEPPPLLSEALEPSSSHRPFTRLYNKVRHGGKKMKTAVKGLTSRMPETGSRPSSSNTNDAIKHSYGSANLLLPDSSSLSYSENLHTYLSLEWPTERRDREQNLPAKLRRRMHSADDATAPTAAIIGASAVSDNPDGDADIYLRVLAPPPPRAGSGAGATTDVTWHEPPPLLSEALEPSAFTSLPESTSSDSDLIKLDDTPNEPAEFDPLKCRDKVVKVEPIKPSTDSALLHEYGLDFSRFGLFENSPGASPAKTTVPKGWTTFN